MFITVGCICSDLHQTLIEEMNININKQDWLNVIKIITYTPCYKYVKLNIMATRITINDEYGRKHEFFYKKVSKEINYAPMARKTKECRLDVFVTYMLVNDLKKRRIKCWKN